MDDVDALCRHDVGSGIGGLRRRCVARIGSGGGSVGRLKKFGAQEKVSSCRYLIIVSSFRVYSFFFPSSSES